MKNSIEWHAKNLVNYNTYLVRMSKKIERLQADYAYSKKQADFKQFQIESAMAEGKKEFDEDRYKVKRSK